MFTSTPMLDMQFSGDGTLDTTKEYTDTMPSLTSWVSAPTESGIYSSKECEAFTADQGTNITHTANVREPPIRVVIASLTFAVNLLVIIALLNSWKTLRQNIYIFALSITCSDCLLGFIHVVNSIVVGVSTGDEDALKSTTAIEQIGPSLWFYIIRASALVTAQVASTGNAACLIIAFKRYVDTLAPGGSSRTPSRSSASQGETSRLRLLSRKTSYAMTAGVWGVSITFGIIPMFWNCGRECACFINARVHTMNPEAIRCYENNNCSYMFPPLKSAWYLLSLFLFFITLVVLVVSCVQVVIAAGGLIAFLPYRLHKYYARKRKTAVEDPENMPQRLRKRSVQMSYMRDMMNFIVILSVAFVVCRLPSATLLFVESLTSGKLEISSNWVNGIVLFSYADSIINPIIFTMTLHGMKEALKKLIEPCCTKTISVSIGKQLHTSEEPRSPTQQSTTTTNI